MGTPDTNGFPCHGDVLTGKLSVEEVFKLEARRLAGMIIPGQRVAPEDYDPVRKFHLGIR